MNRVKINVSNHKNILGIDPGLEGAFALLNSDGSIVIWDVPTLEIVRGGKIKREPDLHGIDRMIDEIGSHGVNTAFLEEVRSMPRERASGAFSFGKICGVLAMALVSHKFKLQMVPPGVWKKRLSVKKGKDSSRLRASELYPHHADQWGLKKHHNRAEAVLIAHYGRLIDE